MGTKFSDYVIYADESGDHSLVKPDPVYPVFVLCLCIFRKQDYVRRIVPAVQSFKFRWFGHDAIVLHEPEIRKQLAPFDMLNDPVTRESFMSELNGILVFCRTAIAACVIDKQRLKHEYLFQDNPYAIALRICVEKVLTYLERQHGRVGLTHFIFEKRGEREDRELELEFRRIADGENRYRRKLLDFEIKLVDKRANSSGLQIADLTARPLGLRVLRPMQSNRAVEIVTRKLISDTGRRSGARAITVFP